MEGMSPASPYRSSARDRAGRTIEMRVGRHWAFRASAIFILLLELPAFVVKPELLLTGGGWVGPPGTMLFAGALWSLSLHAVVAHVDASRSRLTLTHRRWPLPPKHRELDVKSVMGAAVEEDPDDGRGCFRVVLALRNGERLPLTTGFYRGREHQDVFVTELLEALTEPE